MLRTHKCGQLRADHAGQTVTLCGWVHNLRDFGGAKFIVLRDRWGIVQVTVAPESPESTRRVAEELRDEFVVQVTGLVATRPEGQANPKMATGEIEIRANSLVILNRSEVPPFTPSQIETPNEDLRLKYRYLDLRRKGMQDSLLLRHRLVKSIRDYFDELEFVEVETPILGKSTPEGARDYLVPSRVHPGSFYALPQSPQIYKQLMMIAGYDRYIQIARCFRDEDLRADRQPEFTQLDMEMSFVEAEDILTTIDGLMQRLVRDLRGEELQLPLPRMTYDEAMRRFGHDAPDLRFGMELVDCTHLAAKADFRVFRSVAEAGNKVRGINVKGAAEKFSRKRIDELTTYVQEDFGAKGLAWFKVEAGTLNSPIAKNFSASLLQEFKQAMGGEDGDMLLFVADTWEISCKALNGLRRRLGAELQLYDPNQLHLSWVVEFPMFEYDPAEQRWNAMHHPFTAPRPQDLANLKQAPGDARAVAYDLIINGFEAGGGTIRIHDASTQQVVFELLGMDAATSKDRFGFLLDALSYGAPPHGGIALGVDRLAMLFAGLDNIRDCIAFPKTARASDLMSGAPSAVEEKQLKELSLLLAKK
ncbi:MAG TPA: aspartate--tRNA ligase [Pirellulaceae bacterium]|nr:aspartate--tRNA ligase [Pirellulaceae bacterium]HMO93752.1 aspartate--tRNA ligase [Pirellulaceae bacterium]HMP69911.1 aspartate--tRNA ligase [Pirellulaceae bacterium]